MSTVSAASTPTVSSFLYTDYKTLSPETIAILERESKYSPETKQKGVWYHDRLLASDILQSRFRENLEKKYGEDLASVFSNPKTTFPVYRSWRYHIFLYPTQLSDHPSLLEWIVLGTHGLDLIGFVSGEMDTESKTAALSYVEVNPRFQGKGYCKPLVIRTLEELRKRFPAIQKFYIENASEQVKEACNCYLKAAEALKFRIQGEDGQTQTSKVCAVTPAGIFYFFPSGV
jgi:hypothetical protein